MDNNLMVSVCCITYNQALYIREAIEGFLKQKTDFDYEIIIHDDASTDGTVDILSEYEKKYPEKIKVIYEEKNQYKNGIDPFLYTFNKARGKYIAICEGDDYWNDENKLQKQVDYMERNPTCTLCFHNAKILYMESMKTEVYLKNSDSSYKKYINKDGNYDASNIHLLGNGGIPTASFMFRTKYAKKIPDFFGTSVVGDMPLKLIMTGYGYAHYIDEVLSVYRRGSIGSVTMKWKKQHDEDSQKKVRHLNGLIDILNKYNDFSAGKFEKGLDISKKIYEVEIKLAEKKYKEIIQNKEYKRYYKEGHKDKYCFKLYIKWKLPKFYNFCKNIKGKLV